MADLQMVKVRTLKRPWAICQFPTAIKNHPCCTEKAPHQLLIRLPRYGDPNYFGIQMWYCENHLKYVLYRLSDGASLTAAVEREGKW